MQMERDVFVLTERIKTPLDYVRGTNAVDIVFHFRDWEVPLGVTAQVYVQKPSGKAVFNNAEINGNDVTVNVTTQMFAEFGNNVVQIRIVKGEEVLVTFEQPVLVHKNYTEGDAPESGNESGFFEEYIEKIEDAIEDSEKVTESANTAAGKANEAATKAEAEAEAANTAAGKANEAATKADTSAKAANDAVDNLETKVENGEFTGSVTVGTVTTGAPGTKAGVINRGTEKDAVLDFTIPRGDTGEVENIDTVAVKFTQASKRSNIDSGETFAVMFGKIKKYFADLKAAAFNAVANNLTTAEAGSVLDARQGKILNDKKLDVSKRVNDLLATEEGFWLDATQARVLKGHIDDLEAQVSELNGKLEADQSATTNPQGRCVGKYNGKTLYEVTLSGDMSKFVESSVFRTIAVPHNIPNVGEIIAASAKFGGWLNAYFIADGVVETYLANITKTTINFNNKAAWGANYKWTVTIKYAIE